MLKYNENLVVANQIITILGLEIFYIEYFILQIFNHTFNFVYFNVLTIHFYFYLKLLS